MKMEYSQFMVTPLIHSSKPAIGKGKKGVLMLFVIVVFVGVSLVFLHSSQNQRKDSQVSLYSSIDRGNPASCDTNYQRYKDGMADQWQNPSVYASYSDAQFNPFSTTSLAWPSYRATKQINTADVVMKQARKISSSYVLWGPNGPIPDDIQQSREGDCYFLSSLASFAKNPQRIEQLFLTQSYNSAGIIAIQSFVKGIPNIITIDDYLPYQQSTQKLYSDLSGPDNSIWACFMEKAWAKQNGNYELIGQGGGPSDVLRWLTGAPGDTQGVNDADTTWSTIYQYYLKGYPMVASTVNPQSSSIEGSHAYSILGAFYAYNSNNQQVGRLIKLRNPWGIYNGAAAEWTGKWSDTDYQNWGLISSTQRQKFGYNNSPNDGDFFMDVTDFVNNYRVFDVVYYKDGFQHTYLSVTNDNSYTYNWYFTVSNPQQIFIQLESYPNAMSLSSFFSCSQYTMGATLSVTGPGINSWTGTLSTSSPQTKYLYLNPAYAGTYTITLSNIQWASPSNYQDFALKVYASDEFSESINSYPNDFQFGYAGYPTGYADNWLLQHYLQQLMFQGGIPGASTEVYYQDTCWKRWYGSLQNGAVNFGFWQFVNLAPNNPACATDYTPTWLKIQTDNTFGSMGFLSNLPNACYVQSTSGSNTYWYCDIVFVEPTQLTFTVTFTYQSTYNWSFD